jgi:phosphosulfolactate phosphohydrolase-like enzyme
VSEVFGGGYDNSPTQMLAASLEGREIVHKSTNLTTAIFAHGLAPTTLIGGFVNATRLVTHINQLSPRSVELIAASHFAKAKIAIEDLACAEMIADGLRSRLPDALVRGPEIAAKLADLRMRKTGIAAHYWDDVALALRIDALPELGAVRADAEAGVVEIVRIDRAPS